MRTKSKKETKSAVVPIRVTPTVKKRLEKLSKKRDRTVGYIVSEVVTRYAYKVVLSIFLAVSLLAGKVKILSVSEYTSVDRDMFYKIEP